MQESARHDDAFLADVKRLASQAGCFAGVSIEDGGVACKARGSAEPAWYRIDPEDGGYAVSLVTRDRWLSESIEADLMHSGDAIEDLIEEELVDQGIDGVRPVCRHYRSDDLFFTFRTPLPAGSDADAALRWLLAYEACFRNLGDMEAGEEDD